MKKTVLSKDFFVVRQSQCLQTITTTLTLLREISLPSYKYDMTRERPQKAKSLFAQKGRPEIAWHFLWLNGI